jgi:hypothetical protein
MLARKSGRYWRFTEKYFPHHDRNFVPGHHAQMAKLAGPEKGEPLVVVLRLVVAVHEGRQVRQDQALGLAPKNLLNPATRIEHGELNCPPVDQKSSTKLSASIGSIRFAADARVLRGGGGAAVTGSGLAIDQKCSSYAARDNVAKLSRIRFQVSVGPACRAGPT